ncbi:unannotated protein [freshwater metagenome]|uniref:Unannotated protein n=1 Tax=freshwater metagenome TaxID=449393 RepID=A0A6J7EYC7_9ZZZZ|nr:helix-turn-helix domain-containing protein [Actinomycetota bacterium]
MRSETANPDGRSNRVAVLAYDGLSMFEFAVAVEIFGPHEVPQLDAGWYECAVCGDTAQARMDNGLLIEVPRRLDALARAGTVIVPPCADASTVPGGVLSALRQAHERGARIVSLCTGAFVLARAGLLDGRRAATHWAESDAFAAAHPAVTVDPSVLYVDDGDILTSAGSAASIDLCLHIVRLDHGVAVAGRLARSLVVQPHRRGGQAQFIEAPMPATGNVDSLATTVTWMLEHLDEPMTVASLARRAHTSPRSFTRHFVATTGTTPHQWLQRQRLHLAQRLLESSALSVDAVAKRSGLGSAANMRKYFRRHVDISPSLYRETFSHNTRDL